MTDYPKALAAARKRVQIINSLRPELLDDNEIAIRDLVAAIDAARGEAVAWVDEFGNAYPLAAYNGKGDWLDDHKRHWRRAYAVPPAALAVPAVDWRELYRIQTAMRYMDNNPGLTRDHAFSWADQDIAAMLAAANKENNNG